MPYKQTLAAGGGTAPYSYSVISGSLPEGLELSATGVITGTPVSAGSSTFTVEATDASSPERFATRTYALNVQLDLSPKSLHPVTAGSGLVDEELSATGGTGPYTFSVVSGELPEGLYFVEEGGSDVHLWRGRQGGHVRLPRSPPPTAPATRERAATR